MTTTIELRRSYPPNPPAPSARCPHGSTLGTCATAWCRGRLSDETFVVGYEPCNEGSTRHSCGARADGTCRALST
jgi:hypothetical protein